MAALLCLSRPPVPVQGCWLTYSPITFLASTTKPSLIVAKYASSSVLRSLSQIFGQPLMEKLMVISRTLTTLLCSLVCGDVEKFYRWLIYVDYRVPQMLHTLGCLSYSPPLDYAIRSQKLLEPGHSWEVQLRGCSIWCVELLRRQILQKHPDAKVNAILIDFFLYDLAKEREKAGEDAIPHHRTRSIWY